MAPPPLAGAGHRGARGRSVALLVILLDPLGRDPSEPVHKRRAVGCR